jgi:hypothetical protein
MSDSGDNKSSGVSKPKTWQDEVIEDVRKMTTEELFDIAVAAGIYTRDGKLTPMYRG